jgi:hypothetical protein
VSQDDTKNDNQHVLVRKDGHFWVFGTIILLSVYLNKTLGVYIMLNPPRKNDLQAQKYYVRLGSFGTGWATFALDVQTVRGCTNVRLETHRRPLRVRFDLETLARRVSI